LLIADDRWSESELPGLFWRTTVGSACLLVGHSLTDFVVLIVSGDGAGHRVRTGEKPGGQACVIDVMMPPRTLPCTRYVRNFHLGLRCVGLLICSAW